MVEIAALLLTFLIGVLLARFLRVRGLAVATTLIAAQALYVVASAGWLSGLLTFVFGAFALQAGYLIGNFLLVEATSKTSELPGGEKASHPPIGQ